MNKQPSPSKVIKKEKYWEQWQHPERPPAWAFDFISIHRSTYLAPGYSLLSPMKIVYTLDGGARPAWEREIFATKRDAIDKAKQLAKQYNVFIVDCV